MADDTQRRGLIADLTRRLALAPLDDLRVLDLVLTRLEQLRLTWTMRGATSEHDVDTKFHLATVIGDRRVTRCNGSWSAGDAVIAMPAPPVTSRCMSCQRAAWSGTELDVLITVALQDLAADDLARASLRDAARAEMVGGG